MDFGQPILPGGKFPLSASRVNQTSQVVQSARVPRGSASALGQRGYEQRNAVIVSVVNKTNRDINPGDPVIIERAAMDPGDFPEAYEQAAFVSSTLGLSGGNTGTWGIAMQFIKKEGEAGSFAGPVMLKGVTRAKIRKLPGDDNLVDMACFRNASETGSDHKLYTSAAGCATILDVSPTASDWGPGSSDEDELHAMIELHGFRIVEPACWVILQSKLRRTGEFSAALAEVQIHSVTSIGRLDNSFRSQAPGRRSAPRVIRVFGAMLPNAQEAPEGAGCIAAPCAYSGDWIVTSVSGCLQKV